MERTEQQKRIEKALFELKKNAGNRLKVEFISNAECLSFNIKSDENAITNAYRYGEYVKLTLVEPIYPIDLDKWGEAIIQAEEFIGMIENERFHEYQNPNYFKAIRAKFIDHQ